MSNSLAIKSKAKTIQLKGDKLNKSITDTLGTLSAIVGTTLGPGGNVVLLERPGMPPLITKDGVTVSQHVSFDDATQHVISEAAKEVCQRTNREAGDGTTTAIVLAEAMVKYGLEWLQANPGKSPQEVTRELNRIADDLVATLKSKAIKVSSKEDLTKVALVSANFDEAIAKSVIEAVDMVGNDGTIITEEGSSRQTVVEMQDGFPVHRGLNTFGAIQEIFINNPASQEFSAIKPLILLYDGEVLVPQDVGVFLGECMEKMVANKDLRPIIVVAHKFSPQVLKMFAMNVQTNRAQLVPLETPNTAQAQSRHHFLQDLAVFVGANVLDPITNTFTTGSIADLGECGRVKIGRYESYFFDCDPELEEVVEARVKVLKEQMANAESDYDAEIIKERIGHLLGGIATIFVGGSSDLEIKEKKHRIEDAICATRSAIEMGVLPGGGSTLLCLGQALRNNTTYPASREILVRACEVPFCRIASNAGETPENIGKIAERVSAKAVDGIPTEVYDCFKHDFAEPYGAGIIDPVKVTISAFTNALSIAQMLMTTGGALVIPRDAAEERAGELAAQQMAAQMQGV